MKINLPIVSLDTIDALGYQKCLIPKYVFPQKARPGQWAKCYFNDFYGTGRHYYTVTQIFPRDELDAVCYLDKCVTNFNCNTNQQFVLNNLVVLHKKLKIENANMVIQLNPRYFIEHSCQITKSFLRQLAKTLLQKYRLTHNCVVNDSYLLENGIDSIFIEIENTCDNSTYFITDDTTINIKNISLTNQLLARDLIALNIEPFAQAREELDCLAKLVLMQRASQKLLLGVSLNVLLIGAIGCGKTSLLEEFLRSHHCNVFHIEISNCLKQFPGETEAELRKIFKAACDFEKFKTKDPSVLLLEEIHLLCPQPNSTSGNNSDSLANSMRISCQLLTLVDAIFTSRTNIMCLATSSKPDNLNELLRRPGRFEKEILIAALQEKHRTEVLRHLLKQSIPNINITPATLQNMAKHTQGYVIADLALLVRNVSQVILTKSKENLELVILDILKKSKPISLKGTDVTAYRTTETFDSIGGMMKLKKTLEVSVLAGLKHQDSFKRFGLSLPKGVLLYGPPGCAKTTIAKCLATEANMTFIAASGAEVYSPYVGCAEKFISKIFQIARKNSPCLIFLDEIDSLVGRRSLAGTSVDVQVRILSTLLTEMDGVITGHSANILVVAATNRPDMIDDGLMRPGRFDKLIHVPAPDLLSRRSILNLYKRYMPFSKSLDLDCIAVQSENYSGADICNLCNEAALHAFQRNFNCEEITMEDFENVLKSSKPSLLQSQINWYYQFENKF